MKLFGYTDTRLVNFSGGMNTIDSPSEIQNNEWVYLNNFTGDGNKLVTIKGNSASGFAYDAVNPVVGMASFGEDVFFIQGGKLNSFNYVDGTRSSLGYTITGANSTRYNMTTFSLGDIYVVVCDSLGIEDMRMYRFYKPGANWTFSPHTISGLTNLKFTAARYYNGKLIVGGNPLYPSMAYSSKTIDATTALASPDNWLTFTGYNASSQQIGDGTSPIVGFAIRQDVFYFVTKSNVYKVIGEVDNGTVFEFQVRRETNTGAVGYYAICEKEQDVFYFDGEGVRRLSYESTVDSTFSLKDVKISNRMDNVIQSLRQNQSNATMVFDYPLLYTFLRSNDNVGGLQNDIAIVYNVKSEGWFVSDGVDCSVGCSVYNNRKRGVIGSGIGSGVLQINQFAGYPMAEAISKEYTTFDDVDYKRYSEIEITGAITVWATVEVDIIVDGQVIDTREINETNLLTTTTGTATAGISQSGGNGDEFSSKVPYIVRFELFHEARGLQLRFRKSGFGEFEIHTMGFRWKPSNAYDIHY